MTFEELKIGLEMKQNAQELMEIMIAADTDNSGTINYTEFIAATMDAKLYQREEMIRTAFEMFDSDMSGKIDRCELEELLNGDDIKNEFGTQEVDELINGIDKDGDGEIDFDEFLAMMRNLSK